MNAKQKAEVMVRCNPPHMLAVMVEVLVNRHNERPTYASQELLLELAKLCPDMVKPMPDSKPE